MSHYPPSATGSAPRAYRDGCSAVPQVRSVTAPASGGVAVHAPSALAAAGGAERVVGRRRRPCEHQLGERSVSGRPDPGVPVAAPPAAAVPCRRRGRRTRASTSMQRRAVDAGSAPPRATFSTLCCQARVNSGPGIEAREDPGDDQAQRRPRAATGRSVPAPATLAARAARRRRRRLPQSRFHR